MGIDVYLRWDDQTEEEKQAQYTGYATDAGHAGYLREAYHGGPYVTQWLFPEYWHTGEQDGVRATNEAMHALVGSIGKTLAPALGIEGLTIEGPIKDIAEDVPDYPPEGYMVEVEEVPDPEGSEYLLGIRIPAQVLEARLPLCQVVYEQRCRKVYNEEPLAAEWMSFVDFVALVRLHEDAGRKPVIQVSA